MRRMYGDMESTSVYREMRATTSSYSSRFGDQRSGPILVPRDPIEHGLFPSRQYNIRLGSGLTKIDAKSSSKDQVSMSNAYYVLPRLQKKISGLTLTTN